MARRIITNPKFIVERDGDNWVLKFKDGKIYKPIEFNNAQISGNKNKVITNPNFSIEFNDGVPSLLVNIDGVNVNVSNYVAPQPPPAPPYVPPIPIPTDRILYTVKEGGTQPSSTWITNNCSEHVYDPVTREGYLVLNPDVTSIKTFCEDEVCPCIFHDGNGDDSVTSVTFPTQITILGEGVVGDCSALSKIVLPQTLTQIDHYSIWGTINTDELICCALNPPTVTNGNVNDIIHTCYVPEQSISLYQQDDNWLWWYTHSSDYHRTFHTLEEYDVIHAK